jgi:hypothetical protein
MTTEVHGVPKLTATDRCSRCGAQAFVRTMHESGDLLWCCHHYAEHEVILRPLKVVDERVALP